MDKSWIDLPDRHSVEYNNGVEDFLDFAYFGKSPDSVIYCPCKTCCNRYQRPRNIVREHIIWNSFLRKYKNWTYHGEQYVPLHQNQDNWVGDIPTDSDMGDDMVGMVHEAMGVPNIENFGGPDEETKNFFKLMQDAETELYPNCKKFTTLSFVVRLLHIKVLSGWTDKSVTMLLELLNEAFPENVKLPNSYYEASKITSNMGFNYKTFDACPNHCMLFWNEDEKLDMCEICGESRYKQLDHQNGGKKIPAQQVRYFPLKPRLQRLYMSSKTASSMRWHAEERPNDGVLRHPADSLAWKSFDDTNPIFASDSRNVRLGLASDGFNPFRTMSISHSTWPVVLIPYNLPPWLCMKQPSFILSVLIDGPKGPGNKIDVYLLPLIEELKELWYDGVNTYDAASNQMFKLHAALLWTINDFPAYANLSGWSTKGALACPCCNKNTRYLRLKNGGKYCYMGHRRFLKANHKFRKDRVSFDGCREWGVKPNTMSGSESFQQLNDIEMETEYKKEDIFRRKEKEAAEKEAEKARKRKWKDVGNETGIEDDGGVQSVERTHNWRKKSIFFELPYWEYNLIRHNLDVMHIEKNMCDNVLFTLLGTPAKSKDNLKARKDLELLKLRKALHPQPRGSNKAYLPPACFTMDKNDKDIFCSVLKGIKAPDGYSSNISRCVHMKERSVSGLKSHDSHILMQQLLPLAVRKALPKNVVEVLIELSNFFRQLCSKVNTIFDLEKLQDRIAITLCSLEKIFPPAFFDIMEHLPIHLADEALIAGPIQFRWMYPIERYLLTLKLYVRNRAHPEASIANGYIMEECMKFCSMYLDDVETKSNRPTRNFDDVSGRAVGKGKRFLLDGVTLKQAHRYVLANTNAIIPFRDQHYAIIARQMKHLPEHQVRRVHNEQFPTWFKDHVQNLRRTGDEDLSEEIIVLARGPDQFSRKFNAYFINGFRFRTKDRDKNRKTQNSGVVLKSHKMSYASRRDKNPRGGDVTFYGKLTDIIQIHYTNAMQFMLFKCDWVDNQTGMKEDDYKFTLVNFNHLLYPHNREVDEPFILASQAEQVCYVQDPVEPNWHVVLRMTLRDLFDMYPSETSSNIRVVPQVEPFSRQQLDETVFLRDDDIPWVREGVNGATVDVRDDD